MKNLRTPDVVNTNVGSQCRRKRGKVAQILKECRKGARTNIKYENLISPS